MTGDDEGDRTDRTLEPLALVAPIAIETCDEAFEIVVSGTTNAEDVLRTLVHEKYVVHLSGYRRSAWAETNSIETAFRRLERYRLVRHEADYPSSESSTRR